MEQGYAMKVLIVYDSVYGNTERIAKAIGGAITGEVKVLRVDEANPSELRTIDLFILGSPTQGGRPTPAIRDLLNKVPEPSLQGINVAAFDTRISTKLVGVFESEKKGRYSHSVSGRFLRQRQQRSAERGRTRAGCRLGKRNCGEQEVIL